MPKLESIVKRYIGTSRQAPPMPNTRTETMPPGSTYLEIDTGRMWYFTGSRAEGDNPTNGEDVGKWIPLGSGTNPDGTQLAVLFTLQDINFKLDLLLSQAVNSGVSY